MIGNIVFVTGQSNTMNYGTLGLPFPGGWTSDPGIQIWNTTTNTLQTYAPGVNSDGSNSYAVWGPEAEYCRQLRLLRPNDPVYIAKWARGYGLAQKPVGTYDFSPFSSGKGWDAAYDALVGCANAVNALGKRPVATTALICNGETDTLIAADANAFLYNASMNLVGFRNRVQEHNMRAVMMRPFPNSTQGAYLTTVRSAIQTLGGYYRNAWVNTDDLVESTVSPGHLDPPSVVTLGARMFAADQAILP